MPAEQPCGAHGASRHGFVKVDDVRREDSRPYLAPRPLGFALDALTRWLHRLQQNGEMSAGHDGDDALFRPRLPPLVGGGAFRF
jgi:hypothetical protein